MPDETPPPEPAADDPFAGHLAFVHRHEKRLATTLMDRIPLEPPQPLGSRVEDMLDFEALEAIASWQGLLQSPRDKRPDELDPEVEAHMKQCMPQFHLRNIGRAERLSDPEADMELSHQRVPYGLRADGVVTEPIGDHQPVALLEEMNVDVVRSYQRRMNWLIRETDWPRHFCQELKESIRGPLWRYDADAPAEAEAMASPADETEP